MALDVDAMIRDGIDLREHRFLFLWDDFTVEEPSDWMDELMEEHNQHMLEQQPAFNPQKFFERYWTCCMFCREFYPRCVPNRVRCEKCLALRMEMKFVEFHKVFSAPEIRMNIMRHIVPTEKRESEHRKHRLRVILTQYESPSPHSEP